MIYSDLLGGVPVIYDGGINRIQLSSGTLTTNCSYDVNLGHAVFVPAAPWRNITSSEQNLLSPSSNTESELISIIQMNQQLKKKLSNLKLPKSLSIVELQNFSKSVAWRKFRIILIDFAKQYLVKGTEQIEGGVYIGAGNITSTTINSVNNEFVGLHLDSWEPIKYLSERSHAKNRICFNLSSYPRYLCFLNLPLKNVYDLWQINQKKTQFNQLGANDYGFIYEFLKQNPSYPITRVRVEPGEAYIAPTESVLHDGSSEGNPVLDVTYTLRSFYRLNKTSAS